MTDKLKFPAQDGYSPLIPVLIPDLDEVRSFSDQLNAAGVAWSGEVFGWNAEYNPEQAAPPLDSNMIFTPADFCIGESGIWFFSRMWENGRQSPPVEFLDDQMIVRD